MASWNLLKWFAARPTGKLVHRHLSFSPRLEALEDRLVLSAAVDPLLAPAPASNTSATAASSNLQSCASSACVTAGPRLASVDSTQSPLLNGLFGGMLGTSVQLTVLDWNGLAQGQVNLGGLLDEMKVELGTSSPDQALHADATLSQILTAATGAALADGNTELVNALEALKPSVGTLTGTVKIGDLLQMKLTSGEQASTELNALDLMTGSIQLFNYQNMVNTSSPVTLSGAALGLGGVLNSVELAASVVEPPVLACGEAGTTFHSSAIRLKLNLDLVDVHPDTTLLVDALSAALGANVAVQADVTLGQVQLYVDVARAEGVLTQVDAVLNAVTVQATPGVANVYLGTVSDSVFFDRNSVIDPATDVTFGTIGTLSVQVTNTLTGESVVDATASINAKSYAEGQAPLAGELVFNGPYPETQTVGTSAAFIANLVDRLAANTEVSLDGSLGSLLDPQTDSVIVPTVTSIVSGSLTPILTTTLSDLVDPQLDMAGVGIGEMDVTVMGVHGFAPEAIDDEAVTSEDTPVIVSVLANDHDPDGDALTLLSTTQGTNGTVVINPDGTLTYTPNANFNGTDTFLYTITDGDDCRTTATVTVSLIPVNDAPQAVDDAASTAEDTPVSIAVLGNDSDVDGNALTVSAVTQGAHGTIVINTDGAVSYTPAPNFNGTDSFTYTVSDGNGGTSTATVRVSVSPVNDAPLATDDIASTSEDTPVNIAVLGNDSDVDGNALTVSAVTQGAHGTIVINPDGTVSYTPAPNFNGTDSFTYTVSDGNGGNSSATVRVSVSPVNDPPQAVDDSASTLEDTPVSIAVLGNDSDVDGNALTVSAVTQGAHGTIVINTDGTVSYTSAPNFNGTDNFTYTVSDGNGGSSTAIVRINVTPVNDPPASVGTFSPHSNNDADTVAGLNVSGFFSDPDGDKLTYSAAGLPPGLTIDPKTGVITGTIVGNASRGGPYTVVITASDSNGATASLLFTWTVTNPSPSAVNDVNSITEDASPNSVIGNILRNDSDPDGDPLAVTRVQFGATTVTDPTLDVIGAYGRLDWNIDGSYSYTLDNSNPSVQRLAAGVTLTERFTYTISDGDGGTASATLSITITGANDPPVANPDSATVTQNTPLSLSAATLRGNDTDPEGDSLTVTGVGSISARGGSVTLVGGIVTYTPPAGFVGTDTFTYTISDGSGGFNTGTVTVTVKQAPPATLSGFVYRDDGDGVRKLGETGIRGVTVTLTGTAASGVVVTRSVVTDANGSYVFTNVPASNPAGYRITETEPALYQDSAVNVGTLNGLGKVVAGGNDYVSEIVVAAGANGTDYNFGEINVAPVVNVGADFSVTSCCTWNFQQTGSFVDAAQDGGWTGTVNYGDGTALQSLALTTANTFQLKHNYTRAGLYDVVVTIRDSFGESAVSSLLVGANRALPRASSRLVTINDGSAQRSMVNQITITFPEVMSIENGAFAVQTAAGASIGIRTIQRVINGKTVVVIEFTDNLLGGSLADGNYRVLINGGKVRTLSNALFNGGAVSSESFFRFFGDVNGDRSVDDADLAAIRASLRSTRGTANYRDYFDYDSDCDVDATDYNQFLARYRRKLGA